MKEGNEGMTLFNDIKEQRRQAERDHAWDEWMNHHWRIDDRHWVGLLCEIKAKVRKTVKHDPTTDEVTFDMQSYLSEDGLKKYLVTNHGAVPNDIWLPVLANELNCDCSIDGYQLTIDLKRQDPTTESFKHAVTMCTIGFVIVTAFYGILKSMFFGFEVGLFCMALLMVIMREYILNWLDVKRKRYELIGTVFCG